MWIVKTNIRFLAKRMYSDIHQFVKARRPKMSPGVWHCSLALNPLGHCGPINIYREDTRCCYYKRIQMRYQCITYTLYYKI